MFSVRSRFFCILFLYNSGARADEAAQLVIQDLHCASLFVRIIGKGGKERQCPLWAATVKVLEPLIAHRSRLDRVFLNRWGRPITRFGIHALVERHALKARGKMPSLASKRVSPHTIRHGIPSPSWWRGHQHDPWMAGSRPSRYHKHLCAVAHLGYLRTDLSQKREMLEAVLPPTLKRGCFRPADKLIASFRGK
jgi:integrase